MSLAPAFGQAPTPATSRPRDLGGAPPFSSTAEVDGRDLTVTVDGHVPAWLEGDLLRTAPAVFERDTAHGRFEVQHWFDGLGMLYRFRFAPGGVSYRQRLLATDAERAARAGRVDQATWATPIQRSALRRLLAPLPALTDNTNVNVLRFGGDLVALTETTAQWAVDPETLAVTHRLAYRDELGAMPMIAHAHHDFERDVIVNVALQYGRRNAVVVYEHAAAARTRRVVGRIPCGRVPYVHGFGLTPRHAVVYGHPCDVNPMSMLWSNAGFVDHLRWDGTRPTQLHLVDRATGAIRTHLAPTGFMFHVVNAFEDGSDTMLDAVVYPDASVHDGLRRAALLAHGLPHLSPQVVRYRMTPGREHATREVLDADGFEFPIIRYRERNGRRHGVTWGARLTGGHEPRATLVRHGDDGTRTLALDAGFGEPVFVARPGGGREDDGVLLTVGANPDGQRSRLLVVAADTLAVLATATVATPIPLGFHGSFFTRR
jgi:beta,beta-carotene 9',10'-dioxygenase